MKYIKTLNEKYLSDFENQIKTEFGVTLELYDHGEWLQLDKIVVDKNARGEGAGSKVMQRVCDYADVAGKDIRLTPSKDLEQLLLIDLSPFTSVLTLSKIKIINIKIAWFVMLNNNLFNETK